MLSGMNESKPVLGFVGLGAMGLPMATNLLRAGYPVRVHNRTAAKAKPLEALGATICESPAEVAEACDAVFTMLSDDAATEAATIGDDGLLHTLPAGSIHLSCSTISPAQARHLARLHELHDQHYVAVPVYGRPEAAAAGKLWILCSGADAATRERIKPYLGPLSQGVRDFGDAPDAAHVVKVCGNYLIGAAIQAMGEAFTLAEKGGVSRHDTFAFLTDTVLDCAIYKNYGKQIAPEVYEPAGFTMPLALKDMTLAQQLGDETQTPLPFVGVIRAGLTAAIAKGRSHHDFAGLARETSENAGLSPEREIK